MKQGKDLPKFCASWIGVLLLTIQPGVLDTEGVPEFLCTFNTIWSWHMGQHLGMIMGPRCYVVCRWEWKMGAHTCGHQFIFRQLALGVTNMERFPFVLPEACFTFQLVSLSPRNPSSSCIFSAVHVFGETRTNFDGPSKMQPGGNLVPNTCPLRRSPSWVCTHSQRFALNTTRPFPWKNELE